MNQTDLQKAVEIIKDCEQIKLKIDDLVSMGNKLSDQPLKDTFEIKIEKPFVKKEVVIDEEGSLFGESPLKGLGSWTIAFGSSSSSSNNKDYFTENLSVQESLIVINSILVLNREKLKLKINQLKQLGINITC